MKLRLLSLAFLIFASTLLAACNPFESKTKAGLQVITNSIPSTVFLNGQYLEKTPLIERSLKPGDYTLKIQPDDPTLVPQETTVTLRKGLLTVVTWKPGKRPETSGGVIYEMEPLKAKNDAEVSFVTIPDGAIVSLQGRNKEFAPAIMTKVEPGSKEFEVTLPSYETQRHTLNVVSGYRMIVKIKLAKLETEDSGVPPTSTTSASPVATSSAETGRAIPPTASSSADTITGPRVKILSTGFFLNGKEVLRARSAPGASGQEVGYVEVGKSYKYLGESSSNWHKISFDNKEGWVSGEYSQVFAQ